MTSTGERTLGSVDARGEPVWVVRGDAVGLAVPEREQFIERWRHFNDPVFATMLMLPALGMPMPPLGPDHRAGLFDGLKANDRPLFDICRIDDARCLGEGWIGGVEWPHASGEIAVSLYLDDDRGAGHGIEACELMCAYGFDALGLHRVQIAFIVVNERMVRAVASNMARFGAKRFGVAREAHYAFGAHRDVVMFDLLRRDFPPHPATAALRID